MWFIKFGEFEDFFREVAGNPLEIEQGTVIPPPVVRIETFMVPFKGRDGSVEKVSCRIEVGAKREHTGDVLIYEFALNSEPAEYKDELLVITKAKAEGLAQRFREAGFDVRAGRWMEA